MSSFPTLKKEKENEDLKIQGITIHKNKKCDTWYTRYRKNGKQYYISDKTQKGCYNKLKKLLNIEKKKVFEENSFSSWYEKWINLFKKDKVKQTTIDGYKYFLKDIPEKIKKCNIKNITSLDIQKIISEIIGERQKQKVFDFLKDIFTKANKYKIIEDNPFNVLEKPKYVKVSGMALTKEQQNIFIKQCLTEPMGQLFLITLYQGLRKGEVLGITGQDIDLNKKILSINKSWNRNGQFDTTKNIYSNRNIPIFENTFEILKKLKKENSERVFNYSLKQADTGFKKILKNCGLPSNIRIHDLRHTFITNCKNLNIPEHIIQKIVGHRIGSEITSQIYTHFNEEDLQENIDKINAKFYSDSTQKKED